MNERKVCDMAKCEKKFKYIVANCIRALTIISESNLQKPREVNTKIVTTSCFVLSFMRTEMI